MPAVELRSVPATTIHDRVGDDARPLDAEHLVACVESIGALGVLEPLVVDRDLRLLGGAHRRAACVLLGESDGKRRRGAFLRTFAKTVPAALENLGQRIEQVQRSGWLARHAKGLVPVRVIDIDSTKDHAGALAVEAAENTARKSYDADALRALVRRLRAAGYVEVKGRPARGQRALGPALAAVVGLSTRHVARLLRGKTSKAQPPRTRARKPRAAAGWAGAVATLRAAVKRCRSAAKGQRGAKARRLLAVLARVERELAA